MYFVLFFLCCTTNIRSVITEVLELSCVSPFYSSSLFLFFAFCSPIVNDIESFILIESLKSVAFAPKIGYETYRRYK